MLAGAARPCAHGGGAPCGAEGHHAQGGGGAGAEEALPAGRIDLVDGNESIIFLKFFLK
jgi:hypothetical protein